VKYLGACIALTLAGVGISRTVRTYQEGARSAPSPGSPGSLRGD